MNGPRFVVADKGEAVAVIDRGSGVVIAFTTELRAFALARLLNALEPTAEQIDALLGEGRGKRLLRTVELRHPSVCRRCGRPMSAGEQARWNATTKLVQHNRKCPAEKVAHRGRAVA